MSVKLKGMKSLIVVGGGKTAILILLLASIVSCTQYRILFPPELPDKPQHVHSYSSEPDDYRVSDGKLIAVFYCSCGEKRTRIIASDVIENPGTSLDNIGDNSTVVVNPDTAQDVLDRIGDDSIIIFSAGTYEDALTFRQSPSRSFVEIQGDYDEGNYGEGRIPAETFLSYESLADYGIYAYRAISNVVLFAEDGAVFEKGLNLNLANDYDNIRDEYVSDTNKYTSFIAIDDLTIQNWNFDKGRVYMQFERNTSDDLHIDGLYIKDCKFVGDETTMENTETSYAIKTSPNMSNPGILKNVVIEDCVFQNWFKGYHSVSVENLTVTGCEFEKMAYNAIAIQGSTESNTGEFVIDNNIFNNTKDRTIGRAGFHDAIITISNNEFYNCFEEDGELVKLGNGGSEALRNVTISFENNTYGGLTIYQEGVTNASQDSFIVAI